MVPELGTKTSRLFFICIGFPKGGPLPVGFTEYMPLIVYLTCNLARRSSVIPCDRKMDSIQSPRYLKVQSINGIIMSEWKGIMKMTKGVGSRSNVRDEKKAQRLIRGIGG